MEQVEIQQDEWPKALAALYNDARAQGLGLLHVTPEDMTEAEAAELLKGSTDDNNHMYFDYLNGRVMKVGFSNKFPTKLALYNRDHGIGAAQAALDAAGVTYTAVE